jgi:hypothetical protein
MVIGSGSANTLTSVFAQVATRSSSWMQAAAVTSWAGFDPCADGKVPTVWVHLPRKCASCHVLRAGIDGLGLHAATFRCEAAD